MKRRTTIFQYFTVLAVSIVFILAALAGIRNSISRPPELTETAPAPIQPDENSAETPIDPAPTDTRKDDFYLILVGGFDHESGGSDTNLLVALDAKNGMINVLSLPRDTLLNVSWSVKKLNNAVHHGGFERTIREVSNLLGIPVDYYITVNLNAFVQMVDAVGGITFNIPVDMDYDDPYQNLHIHFPAGERLLSGEDALKVVRWRQNNDGTGYAAADIGRIGTQQAFLKAAAAQTLKLSNLDKLDDLAQIVYENIETDLELANILWLAEQVFACGSGGIFFHTLPGDGAGWYSGGSYYILDDAATLELINAHFNPYNEALSLDDMDILVP